MNKIEKIKWEKIAGLVPEERKQKFSYLLKKKINLEQEKKKLQRELEKTERIAEGVTKDIIDVCRSINGKDCPHPEIYRTGAGGHFCCICKGMTSWD